MHPSLLLSSRIDPLEFQSIRNKGGSQVESSAISAHGFSRLPSPLQNPSWNAANVRGTE